MLHLVFRYGRRRAGIPERSSFLVVCSRDRERGERRSDHRDEYRLLHRVYRGKSRDDEVAAIPSSEGEKRYCRILPIVHDEGGRTYREGTGPEFLPVVLCSSPVGEEWGVSGVGLIVPPRSKKEGEGDGKGPLL